MNDDDDDVDDDDCHYDGGGGGDCGDSDAFDYYISTLIIIRN